MKKGFITVSFLMLLLTPWQQLQAQKIFDQVLKPVASGYITSMIQDRQGYIWYSYNGRVITNRQALNRFDGAETVTYSHNPKDSNSLANNQIWSMCSDTSGKIWIGMIGGGLDLFDPLTHSFKHFRHNPKDPGSLCNDTVMVVYTDHKDNLWVGTYSGGLDRLDQTTGKFIHYAHRDDDPSSISVNSIWTIYEDREGTIWVGTMQGGLNRLNQATGKFTRYRHDPANPESISYDFVVCMLEDSRGDFWVGTSASGLQTLNRTTGVFTHYVYDPAHPNRADSLPLMKDKTGAIRFVIEDASGTIWIGTTKEGIKRYDPKAGKVTTYGSIWKGDLIVSTDSTSGFSNEMVAGAFLSKNGLLWAYPRDGSLYVSNLFRKQLPFYYLKKWVSGFYDINTNSFYKQKDGSLWIGTDVGLIYKPVNGNVKIFQHDPHNTNSLALNSIHVIRADSLGNLWIGFNSLNDLPATSGIDKFNLATGEFTHYAYNARDKNSLSSNNINDLCIDGNNNVWASTDSGLNKLNVESGVIKHFQNNPADSNSLSTNFIEHVMTEHNLVWIGTIQDLSLLNTTTGTWKRFLQASTIKSIYRDAKKVLWVGTGDGLYRFDSLKNRFIKYVDPSTGRSLNDVLNVIEDNAHNLWISGIAAIYRLSPNRDTLQIFNDKNGVAIYPNFTRDNYKAEDGELFFPAMNGYYAFYPGQVLNKMTLPRLWITSFSLGNKEVVPGPGSPLGVPVFQAREIILNHTQNTFSIEFSAPFFDPPGAVEFRYMLQGYDDTWHDMKGQFKVNYFKIPVGEYVFKVRAISDSGAWTEKDLRIVIRPPWWTTWWAISLFIMALMGLIWAIVYQRSKRLRRANKVLEEKVEHRTKQLQESLENLKSTQAQLIQSEKMASLGELTAGIAHEIQNPLNFVNNFSELNKEMLEELKTERLKPNSERDESLQDELIEDVISNSEKINHHGKRADGIVKGMLQHSRTSSGVKEPTDINALCDEYLRLSYHGLRAKDKSFNATMNTQFDETVGKINVVPQDIGRVLLNIINNALYAANEKKKSNESGFEPAVTVTTKKTGNSVMVTVSDNGNGIPEKIKDKIFQPFFTTKPTGSGTGLGLSLAYDIVKVQGGEIKVDSKPGQGTKFTVILPS